MPDRIGRQDLDNLMSMKKKEIYAAISEEDKKKLEEMQYTEHENFQLRNEIFIMGSCPIYFSFLYNLRRLI